MLERNISKLPVQLGVRLFLDSISHGNPLPNWYDYIYINYSDITNKIRDKIANYLRNMESIKQPFVISVPRKSGFVGKWFVPTTNDQIILQVCVSKIASNFGKDIIDGTRVFSYQLNEDPSQLILFKNQLNSWIEFQNETTNKLEDYDYILQLDLKDAFASINRDEFFEFLRKFSKNGIELELLELIINSLCKDSKGIPLINDSIFFLGNAYFSVIDDLIKKHTDNFIRFVDDYHIFENSSGKLEKLFEEINYDLQKYGFEVNMSKLRLGSKEQFVQAIYGVNYADSVKDEYFSATILANVIDPEQLIKLIEQALLNPDRYLTDGYGRFILGALRKIRFNGHISELQSTQTSPHYDFTELLYASDTIFDNTLDLLEKYARTNTESWRMIWLLYLMEDFGISKDTEKKLNMIYNFNHISNLVKLWIKKLIEYRHKQPKVFEFDRHENNYLEEGLEIYGV